MMLDPLIIVQARVGGSRFPGKMLAPLRGQPVILWTLGRVARMRTSHTLVVALPPGDEQAPLRALCERHGYTVEQPDVPEHDVLGRYAAVARQYAATVVGRVTGDCPLFDRAILETCLEQFVPGVVDHVGIGPTWMEGMDCEVFSAGALTIAECEAVQVSDREHVTPFIWRNTQRFRCRTFPCPFNLQAYQTSIDTLEDLAVAEHLATWCLDHAGWEFGWRDVWAAMEAVPHLKARMQARPARNHSYMDGQPSGAWEQVRYGKSF